MKYLVIIAAGAAAGAIITSSLEGPSLAYYAVSAAIIIAAFGYAGGQVIGAIRQKDRP